MRRHVDWIAAAVAMAVAAAVAVLGLQVNRQYGCTHPEELPMPACPAPGTDGESLMKERIQRNPADSAAWLQLAFFQLGQNEAVLDGAYALAPSHPQALLLKSGRALQTGKLADAIDPLFRLVNNHGDAQAAGVLARLLVAGKHANDFDERLQKGQRWLQPVLGALTAAKLPRSAAIPLMQSGWKRGVVSPAEMQSYLAALKAEGQWLSAYVLWVELQTQQPVPLIFNGGFDQPLGQGAFNWETPAGSSAQLGGTLRVRDDGGRGQVAEIVFNGRPIRQPMLRQQTILIPGPYVLRGRYSARLRSEHGMAWTVRCLASPQTVVGSSGPLQDTQGAWRAFEAVVQVPRSCGLAAQIQLETFEPYETQVGVKGSVAFDDLSLGRDAR